MNIVQIIVNYKTIAAHAVLQSVLSLGYHLNPVLLLWNSNIDHDDPSFWGVDVRLEVEKVLVVVNVVESSDPIGDDRFEGGAVVVIVRVEAKSDVGHVD